jgi:hypothetical protein
MALFRYFSLDKGLRALATCELMVTPPKYLNDPFECSPVIKSEDARGFVRRQIDQITTSPEFFEKHKSVLPVRTFEEFQSGLRRRAAELEERLIAEVPGADSHVERVTQEIVSERFGVICFAPDDVNQMMWAKYCPSHDGLVIGFWQSHLLFAGPSFFDIYYSDDPVVFDPSSPTARDDAKLFLSRKRLHWSSERESRLLIELAVTTARDLPEGRRYFIPIGPEVIVSVTLGLRATTETQERLIELLRVPHFRHVKPFKIRKNVEAGIIEREPLLSKLPTIGPRNE